ncbi:hypothetical protein ACFU96_48225 [Streptomyces sp. NPDC057620]|uniref:hypothetical protein n=1 Tax=Streptomyces sp. NPDC057620 TaxID=3346185 RepID=UPI003679887C
MTTQGPIAAQDVWLPVIEAAGNRCQCIGQCGSRHLGKDRRPGRCEHEQGQHISKVGEIRLIAAPLEHTTAYPPPDAVLFAWCRPCYDGRRRIANRETKAKPPQEDELFPADEYFVDPASKEQAHVGRA